MKYIFIHIYMVDCSTPQNLIQIEASIKRNVVKPYYTIND